MQGDPHKLDFRNDLLTGLPETGAFGSLPHSQELARPATLFTAAGQSAFCKCWKAFP